MNLENDGDEEDDDAKWWIEMRVKAYIDAN